VAALAQVAREPELAQQEFSGPEFRNALGAFATGVTVITTQGAEHPFGMTANAFSSVSLDPPLVLICVISGTHGADSIERNGVFAVNILGDDHEPISRYFSSKDRPSGPDAFSEIPHFTAVTGSPILDGAAGYLDCRVHAAHEAGDHLVFIGEVVALGHNPEAKPLLFHGGRYCFVKDD
jgi:flavin reductase (DIM6/NTAB) family NADH-FMN oxidoreductase RutF